VHFVSQQCKNHSGLYFECLGVCSELCIFQPVASAKFSDNFSSRIFYRHFSFR